MNTDLRRSRRIIDYLPLTVLAADGRHGRVIAGPFSGRIIDISIHGACLLMTQVLRDGFHVFHSTRQDASQVLRLEIRLLPDPVDLTLTALPVWIGPFEHRQIRAFKMGIEFLPNPQGRRMQKLQQAVRENQEERGNWWLRQIQSGNGE